MFMDGGELKTAAKKGMSDLGGQTQVTEQPAIYSKEMILQDTVTNAANAIYSFTKVSKINY